MRRLYTNAWVVTMDDTGSEHERGWLLTEGDAIQAVGSVEPAAERERINVS